MTLIFAHRGSAGTHPENTMEAFDEAARVGADGIEIDVQLTSDGQVVVIHDETLDRTTNGKGFVKDFSLKDIQKLKANGKWKMLRRCRVPSLIEVFEWMRGNDLLCNIELKNSVMDYIGLEEKIFELSRKYGYDERIIISSFNHYSLVKCRKLNPAVEVAALYSNRLFMPWSYARSIGAGAIHPNLNAVTDEMILQSLNAGVLVRPYTVNKETSLNRLLRIECPALITDFPERAVGIRNTNTKKS